MHTYFSTWEYNGIHIFERTLGKQFDEVVVYYIYEDPVAPELLNQHRYLGYFSMFLCLNP